MATERWSETLRPRNPYEAIDFGMAFVRLHYLRLLVVAAAVVGPLALVLALAAPGQLALASLVLWWLKPFWERPLLHDLGRSFFDAPPAPRDTLAELRRYGFRDLLPWLTWRRFSPTRSFDLPITVLEGTTGRARSERLRVLHRGRFAGAATSLMLVLVHVELFVQLGLLLLVALVRPEGLDLDYVQWLVGWDEEQASFTAELLGYVVMAVASVLVAPFYVAAGFSLYLHRRAALEAWDLELVFRRMRARIEGEGRDRRTAPRASPARRAARATAALSLALVLGASLGTATVARAERFLPDDAQRVLEEILAGEDFARRETVSIPRFVLDWELAEDDPEAKPPEWLTSLVEGLDAILGSGVEILIVALALAGVVWIAIRAARVAPARIRRPAERRERAAAPSELFGLEIRAATLPDDVAAEALAAARDGRPRAALALLYRGALAALVHRHGAALAEGVTEGECVEIASTLLPDAERELFARLTATWLRCAYAHETPARDRLEALCAAWARAFDLSAAAPVGEGGR